MPTLAPDAGVSVAVPSQGAVPVASPAMPPGQHAPSLQPRDGLDMQRRIRHPGWERIAWLNDEGRHIAPNLITIALPAKTPRDEPAPVK